MNIEKMVRDSIEELEEEYRGRGFYISEDNIQLLIEKLEEKITDYSEYLP